MEGRDPALVLVGTPIGNLGDLSPRAVEALRTADAVAAEDTRRTRALLSAAGIPGGGRLLAVHAHNERRLAREIVDRIRRGERIAYVTDAGMPAIADPGERLVAACVAAEVAVEVVPGPSAAVAALVLSGLPTTRFAFEGFLPRKGPRRARRLDELATEPRTVVLYESPHRLAATLAELAGACGADRPCAVARELTKRFEEVWRTTLGEAAERAATTTTLGELVIVVAPAPASADEPDDDELREVIVEILGAGGTARDAAAEIGERFGVPRRRAYDLANQVKGEAGSPVASDPDE
jgi:16S rRNA (cytidine1402-2'-O)-methyltransferase